jgi:nuclear protein localization family protein 4
MYTLTDQRIEADALQLRDALSDKVDFNTLTLSNAPAGGDRKLIKDILPFKVTQIGVK